MDPDTSHEFSKSSRDTLITTAVVGKLNRSCYIQLSAIRSMLSTTSQDLVSLVVTSPWRIQALRPQDLG